MAANVSSTGASLPHDGGRFSAWRFFALLGVIATLWVMHLAQQKLPLYGDEAQYWYWAQTPAFGYYSKPPMVAWAIAMMTGVCGDGEFCIRLPSAIAYIISSTMVYLIARRLFGPATAMISGLAFATLPAVTVSSSIASTDPFLLLWWSIALYAFIRATRPDASPWWWLLTGATAGLGLLAKYNGIFFLPSVVMYLALTPEQRHHFKNPWLYLAGVLAALIFAPNIAWNAQHHFVSFQHVASDNVQVTGAWLNPVHFLEFLGSQFGVAGPIFFAVLLIALWRSRRHLHTMDMTDGERLLWCFTLPMLVITLLISFLTRADPHWASPVYLSGTILIVHTMLKHAWKRWLIASFMLHIILLGLYQHYDKLLATVNIPLTSSIDPFNRQRGWRDVGEGVSRLLTAYPNAILLTTERKMTAELLYYARPRSHAFVKWNDTPRINDHFELTTRLSDHPNATFLLVSDRYDVHSITRHFADVEALGTVNRTFENYKKTALWIYLLSGYIADPQAPIGELNEVAP